ncbi:unnamed protein product, partial [Urochloa humidicola]
PLSSRQEGNGGAGELPRRRPRCVRRGRGAGSLAAAARAWAPPAAAWRLPAAARGSFPRRARGGVATVGGAAPASAGGRIRAGELTMVTLHRQKAKQFAARADGNREARGRPARRGVPGRGGCHRRAWALPAGPAVRRERTIEDWAVIFFLIM